MATDFSTIHARFNAGTFVISELGPRLPPFGNRANLLQYLSTLIPRGWRINLATFENFSLILDLERQAGEPPAVPQYVVQAFQVSLCDEARILNPNIFFDSLKWPLTNTGWRELESGVLINEAEIWLVALWAKDWPRMKYTEH